MKKDIKISAKDVCLKYTYTEYCDRCGKKVFEGTVTTNVEPNLEEADFCTACYRYLIDNKIPYTEAKEKYKKVTIDK